MFAEASQAFQILVGIRDEAHRFAITYHRKLRDYASLESRLDQISGLGKFKKSALLRKFGSVENIKKQTPEEIAKLKYFNLALAQRILNHLK